MLRFLPNLDTDLRRFVDHGSRVLSSSVFTTIATLCQRLKFIVAGISLFNSNPMITARLRLRDLLRLRQARGADYFLDDENEIKCLGNLQRYVLFLWKYPNIGWIEDRGRELQS